MLICPRLSALLSALRVCPFSPLRRPLLLLLLLLLLLRRLLRRLLCCRSVSEFNLVDQSAHRSERVMLGSSK